MSAAERIAKALGGHKRGGRWWACCPCHRDESPSLSLSDGTSNVLVQCFAGCSRDAVLSELHKRGLLDPKSSSDSPTPAVRPPDQPDSGASEKTKLALFTWSHTWPAGGTLVETYLRARGITLPPPPALRFHRALKRPGGHPDDRWPAMVALITHSLNGNPIGIHCTFLNRAGTDKAPFDRGDQRRIYGAAGNGVIRLGTPSDPDSPLLIGEGIETTLSAMQLSGFPGWAALSAPILRTLNLTPVPRTLVLLADGDPAGEGTAAACAARWRQEGRRVRIHRSPPGQDVNDLLMARRPAGAGKQTA